MERSALDQLIRSIQECVRELEHMDGYERYSHGLADIASKAVAFGTVPAGAADSGVEETQGTAASADVTLKVEYLLVSAAGIMADMGKLAASRLKTADDMMQLHYDEYLNAKAQALKVQKLFLQMTAKMLPSIKLLGNENMAARLFIGIAGYYGYLAETDEQQAVALLTTIKGPARVISAQVLRSHFYHSSSDADPAAMLYWTQQCALLDDSDAMVFLGQAYQNGIGVEIDDSEAQKWFTQAAKVGHTDSLLGLGNQCRRLKQYGDAVQWYKKAAEQGNVSAQILLGDMYCDGTEILANYYNAVYWFRKAAQFNPVAEFKLACCYDEGLGVSVNEDEAGKRYREAAEQGVASSQYALAGLYLTGFGGHKPDFEAAVQWLEKAALQGMAEAQQDLAYSYETGMGIEKDAQKAMELYRQSAEKGNAAAQTQMALHYYEGQIVNRDLYEAARWAQQAMAKGEEKLQPLLDEFNSLGIRLPDSVDTRREELHCPVCGAAIDIRAAYCEVCGTPIDRHRLLFFDRKDKEPIDPAAASPEALAAAAELTAANVPVKRKKRKKKNRIRRLVVSLVVAVLAGVACMAFWQFHFERQCVTISDRLVGQNQEFSKDVKDYMESISLTEDGQAISSIQGNSALFQAIEADYESTWQPYKYKEAGQRISEFIQQEKTIRHDMFDIMNHPSRRDMPQKLWNLRKLIQEHKDMAAAINMEGNHFADVVHEEEQVFLYLNNYLYVFTNEPNKDVNGLTPQNAFYRYNFAISNHQFPEAYVLLSSQRQQQQSYEDWVINYSQLTVRELPVVKSMINDGVQAKLAFELISHVNQNGQITVLPFRGTCFMVLEDGNWKVDGIVPARTDNDLRHS